MIRGILRIKNVSGVTYEVAELNGYILQDQDTVDLMDTTLPVFYDDWDAAWATVKILTTTRLYQDVELGNIKIVEWKAPVDIGL